MGALNRCAGAKATTASEYTAAEEAGRQQFGMDAETALSRRDSINVVRPEKSQTPTWDAFPPGLHRQIGQELGFDSAVSEIDDDGEAIWVLVSGQGEFEIRASEYKALSGETFSFDSYQRRHKQLAGLPAEYPASQVAVSGVYNDGTGDIAWQATELVPGVTAYAASLNATGHEMAEIGNRVAAIAERAAQIPASQLEAPSSYPHAGEIVSKLQQRGWPAFLEQPQLFGNLGLPQKTVAILRGKIQELALLPEILRPHLQTDAHIVPLIASTVNVRLAEASADLDEFVNSSIGRGPGWLPALSLLRDG